MAFNVSNSMEHSNFMGITLQSWLHRRADGFYLFIYYYNFFFFLGGVGVEEERVGGVYCDVINVFITQLP